MSVLIFCKDDLFDFRWIEEDNHRNADEVHPNYKDNPSNEEYNHSNEEDNHLNAAEVPYQWLAYKALVIFLKWVEVWNKELEEHGIETEVSWLLILLKETLAEVANMVMSPNRMSLNQLWNWKIIKLDFQGFQWTPDGASFVGCWKYLGPG